MLYAAGGCGGWRSYAQKHAGTDGEAVPKSGLERIAKLYIDMLEWMAKQCPKVCCDEWRSYAPKYTGAVTDGFRTVLDKYITTCGKRVSHEK